LLIFNHWLWFKCGNSNLTNGGQKCPHFFKSLVGQE